MNFFVGKRHDTTFGAQILPFEQKTTDFFSIFTLVQNRSDDVCFVLPLTIQYSCEE